MVNNNIEISVICPTYNEERYITKCIESMLSQDYPNCNIEFLFIDGGSTDTTRQIILEYAEKYPFIKLLDNPHQIVPKALNIGIRESYGSVIIRIDAHCEYPQNYVSTLVKYLFELNADNVGSVLKTLPSDSSANAKAVAIASSHVFGVGNSKFKTGTNKIIETDTVPFGCYKKEVFDKIGLFDEELIRNQDDEFNARLINNGGKILLIPEIEISYFSRSSIEQMAKMYYQYGLFKPLVNKKLGKPATTRQFFPALFLTGLIFGAILSCWIKYFFILYITVLLVYLIAGTTIGAQNAIKYNDKRLLLLLPYTFLIIHISYGWGYIKGIYKVVTKSKFDVKINR